VCEGGLFLAQIVEQTPSGAPLSFGTGTVWVKTMYCVSRVLNIICFWLFCKTRSVWGFVGKRFPPSIALDSHLRGQPNSLDPLSFSRQRPQTSRAKIKDMFIERVAAPAADDASIENLIVKEEAKLLETMPLNALVTFRPVCAALVPRLSFLMLLLHVILLLPFVRYLSVDLGVSIAPFLYIAPALLCVPFVTYFLWEVDAYDSPVLVRGLEMFLSAERGRAKKRLAQEKPRLLRVVGSEASFPLPLERANDDGEESPLTRIAYLRLVANIDPAALCREALALKAKRAGKATALSSSSASMVALPPRNTASASIFDAAKALVQEGKALNVNSGRVSDAELLEDLKLLQAKLDEAARVENAGQ